MLLGTVKLRALGKATVMAKRVARAFSLPSAEPAFNLLSTLFGIFFYRDLNPEYMALIGQPIETLDQWSQSTIIGGGVEKTHPEARV